MPSCSNNGVEGISRRTFLGGVGAVAGMPLLCGGASFGERRLRLGVISDIHVAEKPSGPYYRFVQALRWLRDRDVDGVLIAGDLTERGFGCEMEVVRNAWQSVFPNDKGRSGERVERLFTTGNHDIDGWRIYARRDKTFAERAKTEAMSANPAEFWRRFWDEPYEPVFSKTVKGYYVVLSHWGQNRHLPEFFKRHESELHGDKPFFYVQHAHPLGTLYDDYENSSDKGVATRELSRYPNAVAFSGHSHWPINDPRAIWQGGFTSIACGSTSQIYLARGRENYLPAKNVAPGYVSQMPRTRMTDGGNAMVVDVYDDCMVFERHCVKFDERLGEDWAVPLPVRADGNRPWQFGARRSAARPPVFPDEATVAVKVPSKPGKDRNGKDTYQVVVEFPRASQVEKDGGLRDYEVAAIDGKGRAVLAKRVYARYNYFSEARAVTLLGGECESCVFAKGELPADGVFRFRVTPFDCWGNAGSAIYGDGVKCL